MAWTGVVAADGDESRLVVQTESEPVLHLFDLAAGTARRSWGRHGEGPGEFRFSRGVALANQHIYALDGAQARLAIFNLAGDLARSAALRELGVLPNFPRRLARSGGDMLLLQASEPMGNESVVIALAFDADPGGDSAPRQDTVIAYRTSPDLLRLTAPGAPSWTVPPPLAARPRWAAVSGGMVFWQGPGPELQRFDLTGTPEATFALPISDSFDVDEEDREHWLRTAIPQEFMGQRVFEPIREAARETVNFPEHHPLVSRLLGSPEGFLWVRRTPAGRPQVWDVVDDRGQIAGRIALSPGHRLMALLPGRAVVRVTDDLGVESVQIHLVQRDPAHGPSPHEVDPR